MRDTRISLALIGCTAWLVLAMSIGCDGGQPVVGGPGAAVAPAPPAPPPPPGGAGNNAAGTAATPPPPSSPAGEPYIPELAPYWGKNYIVMVFARERNSAYQKARDAWQAKQTDSQGQPIIWLEVMGPISSMSGQIQGGSALNFQASSNLWDVVGPSASVTSVVVFGKDGKMLFDKRRGGDYDFAAALAPL